jgi:hypothetical protein
VIKTTDRPVQFRRNRSFKSADCADFRRLLEAQKTNLRNLRKNQILTELNSKLRGGIAPKLKTTQLLGKIFAHGEDLKIPTEHFWM